MHEGICADCGREMRIVAFGKCSACYQRARKLGEKPPPRQYTCKDCGETAAASGFRGPLPTRCEECVRKRDVAEATRWNRANPERVRENKRLSYHRHRERNNDACRTYRDANRDRLNEQQRARATENKEPRRRYRLLMQFGITPEQFREILAAQNGKCAICLGSEPGGRWGTFAVDHDHATGTVRGLLCQNCNQGIGKLGDNPEVLRRAADYIETGVRAECQPAS